MVLPLVTAAVEVAKVALRHGIRYAPKIILAAKAGWVGHRLIQNKGDVRKTFAALRVDVIHSYQYVTNTQYRILKAAGEKLKARGGEYTDFAAALLMLAEIVTGTDLKNTRTAVKQAGAVSAAYSKLSPDAKAAVQADTSLNVDLAVHAAYAGLLNTIGWSLLDSSKLRDTTVSEHLGNQYRGLYYIGRSGHSLSAESVDSLAPHLLHFHHQVDAARDAELINWYGTVGVSKPANVLLELLAKCPEVQALGVDVRYIAYALHQPITGLTFDGLKEELEKYSRL